jgi:hypothetical protein
MLVCVKSVGKFRQPKTGSTMGKTQNNARLRNWPLSGKTPAEVAALILELPESIQAWVGRIIWWDRFSFGTNTPEFRQWIDTVSTNNPDPRELAEGLVKLGYRPHDAMIRACGGDDQEKRLKSL